MMAADKLRGLFINCVEARDSIFESGKMVFDCLSGSDKYSLDYIEMERNHPTIPSTYDFYFFNYHIVTMSWLDTKLIKERLPGVKFTMVLEVSPNDPFIYCEPDHFDAYCVLDPTLNIEQKNVFAFPRPLESVDSPMPYEPVEIPVIGSFGFATPGKGFEHVVDAVNREFDEAIVRINIPFATYEDKSGKYAAILADQCNSRAKKGIEVRVTHNFMTKAELIHWCGQNTLNCFLYDRNMPGLAATTDQAIASGRPLVVSKNSTFRHIQKFIQPFPYQTLRGAIAGTQKDVDEMRDAWSPARFRLRFEEVLENLDVAISDPEHLGSIELPIVPERKTRKLREFVRLRSRLRGLARLLGSERIRVPKIFEKSYSQFGEDTIVRDLLSEMSIGNMSYLDIGANNPKFISNTYLFYRHGFTGVLVEPNAYLCKKLTAIRPRDRVLNVGIGIDDEVTMADLYLYDDYADGLSTFVFEDTKLWSEVGLGGKTYEYKEVVKTPLMNINYVIEHYFTECPDFVSIDVEGWDLKILESFDFDRYNPAVFCVETLMYSADGSMYRNDEIGSLLESKGYFAFRQTHANTIFVNKNLYDFLQYQKNHCQS